MSEDVEETQRPRPVGPALVLTAEELVALEEAHTRGLTALPGQPGVGELWEDREGGVVAQARCSLTARGLLAPDGRLPGESDLGQLLQTLLDVRLAAEALVVVERLLGEGRRDVRLLHLVPQGGVVEDLHPEGLHGLDLVLSVVDLVASVTEMVVPGDARGCDGPEITAELGLGDGLSSLPTLLRQPTVLAELTLARPRQEATGHLLALGPRGCWAGPTPAGQGLLRLSPVEPGWVGELLTSWVQDVVGGPGEGTMTG